MSVETTLLAHYHKYFKTVNASTDSLKQQTYHLRYQVYSDKGIISVDQLNDNEIEFDEYDDFAMHSLLFHKPSQNPIGYIRLIPYEDQRVEQLPLEKYCENISEEYLRHNKTGEISRMLIHPSFRRRSSDHTSQVAANDTEDQNTRRFAINYLPMCITLAGLNLMVLSNIEYAVALMERSLAIKLRRQGVSLEQIGKPISLFGQRSPYIIDTEKTCSGIKSKQPIVYELFNVIADEFSAKT